MVVSLFVQVSTLGLGELFRPLEYIDLSRLYERYAILIDLAIYLLIFVGLAQVTLGKRFQGNGGKAIAIGIGVSLAISLAIAEQLLGFSLRSFGPIAAGIFLGILGVMIFRLVQHLGGGTSFLRFYRLYPGASFNDRGRAGVLCLGQ
jgi:hypothetical protein